NGARAGDDRNVLAADFGSIGKLDHRALGTKSAAGQFVRRADAMDLENARQNLEFVEIESCRGANRGQNSLHSSSGPMDINASLFHRFDDGIDLFFGGSFLHGYDHCLFPVSGASDLVSAPVPWPGAKSPPAPCADPDVCARAFLSDANSSLCRARITSMMRS